MSYSLQKLEKDLTDSYKRISSLEDVVETLEEELENSKQQLAKVYENTKDLEQSIDKLKGE
jgi:hypothetical protein